MKNRLLASPSDAKCRQTLGEPSALRNTNPASRLWSIAPSCATTKRLPPNLGLTRAALLFTAAAICGQLQAENIPIVNPSFEDIRGTDPAHFDASGKLRDGHDTVPYSFAVGTQATYFRSTSPLPGWQVTGFGGVFNPLAGAFSVVPSGQNAAYLDLRDISGLCQTEPIISQVLCRALTPGRYTLEFSVGRYPTATYAGYWVKLLAGGNIIGQEKNIVVVSPGTFAASQIVAEVPTNHPALGQLLEIRLGGALPAGSLADVRFDDISLDGPASSCAAYANSVADFSNAQGSNNWYYGYYSRTDDVVPSYDPTNDFSLLPRAHGADLGAGSSVHGTWNLSANFWTSLGSLITLPNSAGSNSGKTLSAHWVIRRWISEVTGLVRIHGLLAKNRPGGDGVIAAILVNGRTVYERHIAGDDCVGVNYSVPVGLKQGDFVDFVIKDGGSIDLDYAYFTAIIEPAPFALQAGTAVEVATPTVPALHYQLHFSPDAQNWRPVGNPFTGTGETMYILFSFRDLGAKGFFKVETLP